ncbi:MAG TPA: hypothetical protein VGL57_06780 [Solirubrobacteraceae bacterium]
MALLPVMASLALCGPAVAAEALWAKNGHVLTETVASTWKGNVKLSMYLPGNLPYSAGCEDTITGTVGPKGATAMTKWTFSNCKNEGGECKKSPSIEALGSQPWDKGLAVIEKAVNNVLEPSRLEVGLRCGEGFFEVCNHVPNEILTNATGGVKAEYSRKAISCTLGERASFEGKQEITLIAGGVLSVKSE